MFKNILTTTPMSTETANDFFNNRIYGESWSRDMTFLSTLRALLNPRMSRDDSLYLSFSGSNYTASQLNDLTKDRAVRAIVSDWIGVENMIHVHNFRSIDADSNASWISFMESSFTSVYEDWHRVEKVTAFFHKVFTVLCYINPAKKSVILFTNNMDVRRMHYLQCGIFAFIPWYFDPEKGVSDLEMELISSLREKTSEKYEACLAKFADKYEFEKERVRKLLRGFETRYEQIQCDRLRSEISNIMRTLESLDRQYADNLKSKRDSEAALMGLEMKIASGGDDSEIMDYFLAHKQLSLEKVRGSQMEFTVRTTLDFFDEDLARRVIENNDSFLYRNYDGRYDNGQISTGDMRELLTEIFLNQTLRIRFCAAYRFDMGGSVTALSSYEYGAKCKDYMPNPHIDRYSCLGNYKRIINDRLKENDYIGAIEQCIASAKSLNFGDGAVMGEFVSKMYAMHGNSRSTKFIETPDGKVLTVKEALAWVKDQKGEEKGE